MSSMLWGERGRLSSWANSSVGIQSCPTPPRRASGMTGFWVRQVSENPIHARHVRECKSNLSNPKPGHTTDGSKRGGARRSGGVDWDASGSVGPGNNHPSCPRARRHLSCALFGSTKNGFPCKPMGEQNARLTSGLDRERSSSLAADQGADTLLSL